jgi:DNA-binding MarR family transcriptional regulator
MKQTNIEIFSLSDFLRKDNTALVHLLKVVRKAGPDGISTRKLCIRAFDSQSYGLRVIERAEKEGYIIRTGKRKKKGGGRKRISRLTEKGRLLLEQLSSTS